MFHVKHSSGAPGPGAGGNQRPVAGCRTFAVIEVARLPCLFYNSLMLTRENIRDSLSPFIDAISDEALDRLLAYLQLLLRWNRKINLTSISTAEDCVTRHFGESFLVSRMVSLRGRLLDIGSGAGFPGLALKLIAPNLRVVLLEPVGKKRAFLKEAARTCGMTSVQVDARRLEEFSRSEEAGSFDIITVRAVGGLESLIPAATTLLNSEGCLCLWVGSGQVKGIRDQNPALQWQESLAIPLSDERQLLVGRRSGE